jgi:transcriptional regulator GlxA family with amidase domain
MRFGDSALRAKGVASAVGVSRDYLSHLFVAHTGKGLLQVLHEIRVSEAAWLLESTTLNIKEVMARSGYRTYRDLDNHFKRARGLTPRLWRCGLGLAAAGQAKTSTMTCRPAGQMFRGLDTAPALEAPIKGSN